MTYGLLIIFLLSGEPLDASMTERFPDRASCELRRSEVHSGKERDGRAVLAVCVEIARMR